ncbi:Uncharacterised protein [Bordetella pertussis]|nr:Uncharacterised protein [Bordetella pertussis]CPN34498.1 Uncharacterised protein [Bordetella pertussis]
MVPAALMPSIIRSTWLPASAVTASTPLYGMWRNSTPVSFMNTSPARWVDEPTPYVA